jgi:leucyl-tRNA synthetase
MLERGLAYRKRALVNWCPKCATVLANEQVVEGCCWRHEDTPVEQRALEQWFLKITQYADELLDDMSQLEGGWPERVLTMQRNWIGRSEGTEVDFHLDGPGTPIRVFTTRVDTIYGATCVILAPEHPLNDTILEAGLKADAKAMVDSRAGAIPAISIRSFLDTTPSTIQRRKVPIWVANFVLMGYGTAAIMAVPAHDERDFDSAASTISGASRHRPVDGTLAVEPGMTEPFCEYGIVENSGQWAAFQRRSAPPDDRSRRGTGFGKAAITYRLRTGASRASVTGARRSRSSIAPSAVSFRCRKTSSRDSAGPHRNYRRRTFPARKCPGSSTWRVPCAAPTPGGKRIPWTPSSTAPYFYRYATRAIHATFALRDRLLVRDRSVHRRSSMPSCT